ncbi:MAG: site-specific integrase [Candidatus Microthrix subdominans]
MTSKKTARNNIRKRGNTYTYYVYGMGPDGTRKQHTQGGFATQKEALAAQTRASAALLDGSYVADERQTFASFLVDEWLPTKRAPTLEESTFRSYERNLRLHVIPNVGAVRLTGLTPMHLNQLYRSLLDSGRRPPTATPRRFSDEAIRTALVARAGGQSCQQIADMLNSDESFGLDGATRHSVAALLRRQFQANRPSPAQEGLSPRTVRYIHTIIRAALRDAVRWNKVGRNIADSATPPPSSATQAKRTSTWTGPQVRQFFEFVAESRYLPAWLFLATSGCRRGEALGLRWSDVDLESRTAIIGHQVVTVDHEIVFKDLPKTKRAHVVRLDPGTVSMLQSWKAAQNGERLLGGAGYAGRGLVFAMADGRPYHPERFSREFQRKQEQFNRANPDSPLPRLVLHGLRHTWATLALQEGIDIKIVSDRLNHSSTHITREIYTHVTPPMQSDAADRVASQIFGN